MQENRDFIIAETDFIDEVAQVLQRMWRFLDEFFVVNGQDKGRSPALLLDKRGQIAIAGHPEPIEPLILDSLGKHTNPQTRRLLGAELLITTDNVEMEFHGYHIGTPSYRERVCQTFQSPTVAL